MIRVGILTISDTRSKSKDISGKVIKKLLSRALSKFKIDRYDIVIDDREQIKNKLTYYTDVLNLDLVLTTGGTGIGPRDVTPEATLELIEKELPGISELMRIEGVKKTKTAVLSRGISGTRKQTLIINLPGSPKGVEESLNLVLDIILHAIDMLKGKGH